MITKFESRVRFSEVDGTRYLSLKSIVDYMQDACTFQSEDLGETIDYMNGLGLAWLLASWQIEVQKRPKLGDHLVISTWPSRMKGFFAYRCHAIESPEGEVYASGNSIWFLMDQKTLHPVKIGQERMELYKTEERLDMPFAPRRVRLSKDPEELSPIEVAKHLIDTNGHVNNSQYIQIAEDCLPADFRQTGRIRVEYVNGAEAGDIIIPKVGRTDEGVTVDLSSPDGRTYAAVEFR